MTCSCWGICARYGSNRVLQGLQCSNFLTIYWGYRLPARHRLATQAGGIDTLESIPGLLNSLKIPSHVENSGEGEDLQQLGYERVQMRKSW